MPSPIQKLALTAEPATEPVNLSDAKLHLRVTDNSDDSLISGLITSARMVCEAVTGVALINRTYCLYIDAWDESGIVTLPKPPLVSITSIQTRTEEGTAATYAASNYYVDNAGIPGRIIIKTGATAPLPDKLTGGIEINFTAGYGASAASVPAILKQGMMQMIAHLYENRGDSVESALQTSGAGVLFQPFRQMGL